MFVILVRSDDVANVAVAVRLQLSAACPKSTRLEKDLGTGIAQEPFIPGDLPILPDRKGDVRANVLLLLSAKDIDNLTIRTNNLLAGCSLRLGVRRYRCRDHAGAGYWSGSSGYRYPLRKGGAAH